MKVLFVILSLCGMSIAYRADAQESTRSFDFTIEIEAAPKWERSAKQVVRILLQGIDDDSLEFESDVHRDSIARHTISNVRLFVTFRRDSYRRGSRPSILPLTIELRGDLQSLHANGTSSVYRKLYVFDLTSAKNLSFLRIERFWRPTNTKRRLSIYELITDYIGLTYFRFSNVAGRVGMAAELSRYYHELIDE